MTSVHFLIFVSGVLLEVLLLWRCKNARLLRHYPFVWAYVGFTLVRSISLFLLWWLQHSAYPIAYWQSQIGVLLFQLCVAWEVFRHVFPSSSPVRVIGSQLLLVLMLGISLAFLFGGKASSSLYLDVERKIDLAEVVILAVIILLARYYAVPLGRNIWGIAVGMGINASASVMNQALYSLAESFYPYWQAIRPLGFVGMLAVWTWALWSYAPNPEPAPSQVQRLERLLPGWQHGWNQMRATLRKAVRL